MTLNYDVHKNEDYNLNPHEASRRTEEELWDRYAIDKNHSGTLQILYSKPSIIKPLIENVVSNDINTSYRFRLACIYNIQLRKGLKIQFYIGSKVYTITPINRTKYTETSEENKKETVIQVCQLPDSTFRFYYPENKKMCYRDYTRSKKGKIEYETPDKIPHTRIGSVCLHSAYCKDWKQFLQPDLDKMGLTTEECTQEQIKAIFGGLIFERNDKQVVYSNRNRKYKSKITLDFNGQTTSLYMIKRKRFQFKEIHIFSKNMYFDDVIILNGDD